MSTIEQQIVDFIRKTKGVENVTRSATWEELGFDSLDVAELLMELEDQFHVAIPDADAANLKTVGHLIDYLERAKTKAAV
jgi:acyl carrier protein